MHLGVYPCIPGLDRYTLITWTENDPTTHTGSVAGFPWFRVYAIRDQWFLASSLPVPLDLVAGTYPTLTEAQDAAELIRVACVTLVRGAAQSPQTEV